MFTNIILISVLLIQLVILYLIYKDSYFKREPPDGYILKKLIEITGGYTSKVTAQYIQRKFKTKDGQTSRILESLKDPEMTKTIRSMPIYYKEIGENVAFSSFVLLLLAIYFGISIYFSKKEDYYHPYEADYQEWLEGKNEEIWTGLD